MGPMDYVAVGAALLLWGALVGRASPAVGTILALIPLAGWFALSQWSDRPSGLLGLDGDRLLAYLLIGLLAFVVGSNFTSRSARPRGVRKER